MKKRAQDDETQLTMGAPAWEVNMNPEQLQVIGWQEGPARVLAAAGSGKTRALVHRIARMVAAGADSSRILAMTFSKKAADEMNKRLDDLRVRGARVGTWHSLCLQIIREDRVSPYCDFEIDDKNRAKYVLKEALGWKGMDWKGADLSKILRFIGTCKANLFAPESEGAAALAYKLFGWQKANAVKAFARYETDMAERGLITFDDMLVRVVDHFEANEDARMARAARHDFGLCDEYQDNNRAQNRLAKLLFGDHRNFMAIGDLFQAIYSFRGSSPDFLADFEKEWPGAVTITLPRNYRSGRAIIAAANGIVAQGRVGDQEPMVMIGERDLEGSVTARAGETLDDEANNFVSWIKDLQAKGAELGDVTSLFRTNAQSRALEEALLKARLPYVVVGGTSFYERKEVKDLLAYIRVAAGRGEAEDVKRCINAPFRFLGAKFVEKVMAHASAERDDRGEGEEGLRGADIDWVSVVDDVAEFDRVQSRQADSAREWGLMVRATAKRIFDGRIRREAIAKAGSPIGEDDVVKDSTPAVILADIVRSTKYIEWLTKEEGEESIEQSGAANVREMIRVAERFGTVHELLDYIDETIRSARRQRMDRQAGGQHVLLMSVHRSKGLEWPHVWVAGFNEMILPHARGDIEEERRLAYVAATRARDTLVLSYVRSLAMRAGIKDAAPSRFLHDSGVPEDLPREVTRCQIDLASEVVS